MSVSKNSPSPDLDKKRHSLAHLMAASVQNMFPEAQFGVGPVIENGCYYDFILPRTLIPEDLPLIEEKMRGFLKRNLAYKVQTLSLEEAVELFENRGQKLKVELLMDLKNKGTTKLDEAEAEIFGDSAPESDENTSAFGHSSLKEENTPSANAATPLYQEGTLASGHSKTQTNRAYIVEKSLPDEKFQGLSYFGAVALDKVEGDWGKLVHIYYDPSKESELVSYLEQNLLEKSADGSTSWYAEVGSKVVFSGKVIDLATDDGFLDFVDYGRSVGIPEEQLDAVSAREMVGLEVAADSGEKTSAVDENTPSASAATPLREEGNLAGGTPKITVYRIIDEDTGEVLFEDLCKGPHVEHIKELQYLGFKLDKFSGAYWRGDQERNVQMQRVYALVFETQPELDKFLEQREEAKKRDHRVLGEQLKLFTISDLVGAGLVLMQPHGMILRKTIEDYLWQLHKDKGYLRVWTPHIAKEDLYVRSGHAAKFGDELFRVQGKDEQFFMKPMNCPHHMQIFADNQFSYRDMPVRYFEPATVYRDEKTGQLSGLTRVRSITQDDGHLFCRVSQIGQEVSTIVGVIKEFFSTLGMEPDWVSLSVRDSNDHSKYLGEDAVWETAEKALEEAAKENGLNYKRVEGEAAFYGPKLDFMFRDVLGRQWQLSTIQCDFNLPERFDLSYVNEAGEKERPVVIHRAISGSLERFTGILIEHFGGRFPLWLAPVQVKILTVNDSVSEYVEKIKEILSSVVLMKPVKYNELRYEVDDRSESLGKKIREAEVQKIPVILIVGPKDVETGQVSVRTQEGESKVDLDRLKGLLEGI